MKPLKNYPVLRLRVLAALDLAHAGEPPEGQTPPDAGGVREGQRGGDPAADGVPGGGRGQGRCQGGGARFLVTRRVVRPGTNCIK